MLHIILFFSTTCRFEQQIAKVSISPLQCEPYTDVPLSTRVGEVNETVIGIQSNLTSFVNHINDTFSTLKEDINNNLATIDTNLDAINSNSDTINANADAINSNSIDIDTNSDAINRNSHAMKINVNGIAAVNAKVANNTGMIGSNAIDNIKVSETIFTVLTMI